MLNKSSALASSEPTTGFEKRGTRQLIAFAIITTLLRASQSPPKYNRGTSEKPFPVWKTAALLAFFPHNLFLVTAPEEGEEFEKIADDYQSLIMPGTPVIFLLQNTPIYTYRRISSL